MLNRPSILNKIEELCIEYWQGSSIPNIALAGRKVPR